MRFMNNNVPGAVPRPIPTPTPGHMATTGVDKGEMGKSWGDRFGHPQNMPVASPTGAPAGANPVQAAQSVVGAAGSPTGMKKPVQGVAAPMPAGSMDSLGLF